MNNSLLIKNWQALNPWYFSAQVVGLSTHPFELISFFLIQGIWDH